MQPLKIYVWVILIMVFATAANAQQSYVSHSVLANGNWYKIAATSQGVYKIDVAFLNKLGINTNNLSSSSIQLFGNGGGMLNENNAVTRQDDLFENAIEMNDGGDGIFNNNDYFLFYAEGANKWNYDSTNKKFSHQKNLFSDTVYYYLMIGSNGKRITQPNISSSANITVTSFDEHYFYENDITNFLNSGKEWYGEQFGNGTGSVSSRNFSVDFSGLITSQPLTFNSSFAAAGVGNNSVFTTAVNNQQIQQANINSVSGYFLDVYANTSTQSSLFTTNSSTLNIGINFSSGATNAQGWLNWFEILGKKNLTFNNNQSQLFFRDTSSVGNNVASFVIDNSSASAEVWDITNPLVPQKMNSSFINNQTTFFNNASTLKEYVAFNQSNFLSPTTIGKINNQDLHGASSTDFIIITPALFYNQAKQLADFHSTHDNLKPLVVTTEQIYNEFSSGMPDPTALRDFVKMMYDKYNSTTPPKYLLLFGAASYDYKNRINNNTNFIPAYESSNSTDPLLSYTTDDFYGFLEDNDDINNLSTTPLLKIGIGRLPARNIAEATNMVNKITGYFSSSTFGNWRNQTVYVGDNEDDNLHLNDAEAISADAAAINNLFNQQKIYVDAYKMQNSINGTRFPDANTAIVNAINNGTFIFNYNGHGGYQQLSGSAILTQTELQAFTNKNKLPLFITATCDFAPYDNPIVNSLGESLLYNDSSTGAIALMTTTRPVIAASNEVINDNYLKTLLQPDVSGNYYNLGDAIRLTKNYTYQTYNDILNNRKFTLLGDPALQLAFPKNKIRLLQINDSTFTGNDTIAALHLYNFSGRINDVNGNLLPNFNGNLEIILLDKPDTVSTLGNDAASPVTKYVQQTNVLYKGSATVKNGLFNFSFVVPKDINYQTGKGKLSLYATDSITDAAGFANINITGNDSNILNNTSAPLIHLYLNDTTFKDGGTTNEQPILIAHLFDSLGINISDASIGHNIELTIDGDENNSIVLNNYYQSALNNYQSGSIQYQLQSFTDGAHFLSLKAWNVNNISAEATIHFKVEKQKLAISNLFNYPNPFSNLTTISFQCNQSNNASLNVALEIFSSNGQLVYKKQFSSTSQNITTQWDGRGLYGEKIKGGIYFYRIIVQSNNGSCQAAQKLLLL